MAVPALAQDGQAIAFMGDGSVFVVGRYDSIGSDTIGSYLLFDTREKQQLYEAEKLTPEEYKAWAAENGHEPARAGKKSPDGKREIQVTGKGGQWRKDEFFVAGVSPWTGTDGPEVKMPPPSKFRFSVKAGKKSWPSADFVLDPSNTDYRVEFFWSPDGGRVAYLVHHESATEGGGVDFSVVFGPTQGPRVQVLGVKGTTPDAYLEAQLALELAGLPSIAVGEAKSAHPTTVIFAAKGFEAEARKALKELPGARIEKLTWQPGYDLVVVLGGK